MFKTKIVSSQEKVFVDESIDAFAPYDSVTALGGERLSFQLLYVDEGAPHIAVRPFCDLTIEGELAQYVTVRDVRWLPVDRPVKPGFTDENYLRVEPGIYPDILTPLRYGGKVVVSRDKLRSLWVETDIPQDFAGRSTLSFRISLKSAAVGDTGSAEVGETILAQESITIDVIPACLPEQEIMFTQWFYADCLAAYYDVEPWSERHWEIVENFAQSAVKRGRNMLYYGLFYQDGLPWCTYFGRYRQEEAWDHCGRSIPIHLLVYVIGGKAVFHIQDSDYTVSEGDLFLIRENTHYSVETDTFCEFYYFHFKGCFHEYSVLPDPLINRWGSGYPADPTESVRDPEAACFLSTCMHFHDYKEQLMPICARMHHYLYLSIPEAEYEFQLIFSQFLLELSKCLRKENGAVSPTPLNKIIYYIHENISKSLSLNDLAEHFHVSKSYLIKMFRQSLNTSVTVYINRIKMDYAAQLLRTSMMNVSEISDFLGYHDPAYFSRVFKKYFGQSPSKYIG